MTRGVLGDERGFGHERFLVPVVVVAIAVAVFIPVVGEARARAATAGESFWAALWVQMTNDWLAMLAGGTLALALIFVLVALAMIAWYSVREE